MSFVRDDGSYALAASDEEARRRADLRLPHVAPLTVFVEGIRAQRGLGAEIPFFDPCDGGILADALFLLEAPGRNAVCSGFISRERTVLWNIVPWYLGTGTKIRAAGSTDIAAGVSHLPGLLKLLPGLRVVVLVGRKAQRARVAISRLTDARLFSTLHPSNQVVTCWPERRAELERDLHALAAFLLRERSE